MAPSDHGVYEPGDDIRVFDGSEDEEDVEGSRLPLLIVLALLVLAMFAGVVWLAYTQGVARGRTETPVLTAQNGPARVAPQTQGAAAEPYKGFKIYQQPAPPDDEANAATTPTTTVAPAQKPMAVAPPPLAPRVAVATPVPPPAKAVPAAAKPPAPVVVKKVVPPAGPATAAPRSLALATPKPAPAAPAAASGGAFVLQIGAYKSQAEAEAAWKVYKVRHGALLASATDDVQQADLGDKGIWFRLRLTGFPSKDVASAMCDRLKADGGGCFLGK
ncbi:MAG TPA: SPOR domain-containing protein [Rhizomicrobium sp.]|nr:SPOR domain-containing protein [Rhizomicrobium sp.]